MDNNPYRVVFQSLPFDEAIEFSIKYARNKVNDTIESLIRWKEVKKMLLEPIKIIEPECNIVWIATDGKKFDNPIDCEKYDRPLARKLYYEYLLQNRNWFQRTLNLKPNMDFYDAHS